MKYVQHSGTFSGSLRSQATEQPVETMRLGELSTVCVVSLDNGSCNSLVINGNEFSSHFQLDYLAVDTSKPK